MFAVVFFFLSGFFLFDLKKIMFLITEIASKFKDKELRLVEKKIKKKLCSFNLFLKHN